VRREKRKDTRRLLSVNQLMMIVLISAVPCSCWEKERNWDKKSVEESIRFDSVQQQQQQQRHTESFGFFVHLSQKKKRI
jgi:hypothetical protein